MDVQLSAEGQRLRINAPKGVLTAPLRDQIAKRKAEILDLLHNGETAFRLAPLPIRRRAKDEASPLSFAQERLWFLEQLEPGSSAYNICRAARLTGTLNVEALQSSLDEMVRRHEVLRVTFDVVDGRPVQVIVPEQKLSMSLIELQQSTSDRDVEARRLITDEAWRPFDLSAGPLLRTKLLRLGVGDHILILTTHHIVSDAWSMGILNRELWTLYDTYANGRPYPLKDLAVQYVDYAVWQREWLQGEVLERSLSYWKQQLAIDLPVLSLPTNFPRPPIQSFRGARQRVALPESLTTALNELSQREGVTLFMTLLAAFQTLLYRYTGQEDIVIGAPVANRARIEVEELIGFFVNTLVLRTDLSGKPTFRELLLRVRDVCFGAYANQDLPFEKLVEELKPERDLSRNPLFQVMFLLQNAPSHMPKLAELTIGRIGVDTGTSKFDLTLGLAERDDKLVGFFEYNTDLFDHSTIERMIAHFETLLEGIVVNPDRTLSTLPILTEAERHQLLVAWNDTAVDYPKDSCMHELFEAQVEKTPEAIAVEVGGKCLTYRELNGRANQVARYLQGLGVGAEKLVGICVERSLEMVVGLLGILKAGGAYVPLDPAYPRERLAFMLEDAQVSVLLTQEWLAARFIEDGRSKIQDSDPPSSILDRPLVCLGRDWDKIAEQSDGNFDSGVTADNLAYVIYTSGSTGQPKGVAIEHRNTVALLHWAESVFEDNELAGVLAATSICFDLSVFEIFVPLSFGGKVIMVENALRFSDHPRRTEVTLVNTVPSVMNALLAAGPLPDSVRVVNLAGEPLSTELVDKIYEQGTVRKVYDLYGPSESTTYSTFALRDPKGFATIGRPIANTEAYIMDARLQPVPVGVPGEIFIGGAGLARGYLNRPELTAERFIPNPFSDDGGDRLYRTGDRGRYRSDGNIEFLGRSDNQVKIRGCRIELGEIETTLNQHPEVKESVVVARDRDPLSENNLVAYFLPRHDLIPSTRELRSHLKAKLPDYMLPSIFVPKDVLPLTANGKIDRHALALADQLPPTLPSEFVEPSTEMEELVARVWRQVLSRDRIGIYDNFFELGGHSLVATEIVARLREIFHKDIHLRLLFDAPTIAELAIELERIIRAGHGPELPPIMAMPRGQPLPLSLNQEHLWILDKMIPGTHLFNMPYVYRISGECNVAALEMALQEIVRRHEVLRTVFREVNGKPVQIVRTSPHFEVSYADLRGDCPDDVSVEAARRVSEERHNSFDLASGPLLRVSLLRLTGADYLLLVTLHHIVGDHWSMQVFRRELAVLYGSYSEAHPSPLVEPAIQFGDYAVWERDLIDYGLFEQQLNYWKSNLAPPLPELVLLNRPGGINNGISTTSKHFELNGTDFQALKTTAQNQNRTVFIYFMSALAVWLHYLSGEEDIRIVTLLANRNSLGSHRAMGPFANKVILRLRVNREFKVEELLAQMGNVMFAAHRNQELPFELLTRVLETQSGIKRETLSNVLALYNRTHVDASGHRGLYLAPINFQELAMQSEPLATSYVLTFRVSESSTRLTGTVNYEYQHNDYRVGVNATPVLMSILMSMVSAPEHGVIGRLLEDFNWKVTSD